MSVKGNVKVPERAESTIWFDKEYLKALCKKNDITVGDLGPMVGKSRSYFSSQPTKSREALEKICYLLEGDWESLIGAGFSNDYKGIEEEVVEEEKEYPAYSKMVLETKIEKFRSWILKKYKKGGVLTAAEVMIQFDKMMG